MQTKFAVGVQNLDPHVYIDQLQANIDELPDASGADAAFIALISEDGRAIETVLSSSTGFAQCTPGLLADEKLEDWLWLRGRLGHLRVVEVADTLKGPKAAQDDLERLNELHIGSALIIGFSVHGEIAGFLGIANEQPVDGWDANLHLLMKLFGSSLAVGLERVRDKGILAELQERNSLVAMTANDGIWDFDGQTKRINLSRRWKTMLGYDPDEEDVKLDWYNLVHPDDIARVQTRMREHLEGKAQFFESVHRMKHQGGDWRWMKSRAKCVI
ncbi:MAG TPA: PAS domain-containing protein, partial [Woeseiaceae bacterium]|nr:PAS domain-containing protein [Woeseiaceae bacterium]